MNKIKIALVLVFALGFYQNSQAQFFETLGKVINTANEAKKTYDSWTDGSSKNTNSNSNYSRNDNYSYVRTVNVFKRLSSGVTRSQKEEYQDENGNFYLKNSGYVRRMENPTYDPYETDNNKTSYYMYRAGEWYYN